MKKNDLYIYREIAGESLLVPVGAATKELNGMIQLRGVAGFIWESIDTADNLDEIAHRLCEEYEVDEDKAKADVYNFCKDLYQRGLIEDVPEFAE